MCLGPYFAAKNLAFKILWENPISRLAVAVIDSPREILLGNRVSQLVLQKLPVDAILENAMVKNVVLFVEIVKNWIFDNPLTRMWGAIWRTSPKELILENPVSQFGMNLVRKPVNAVLENEKVLDALISTESHINNYLMKTPLVSEYNFSLFFSFSFFL